MASNQHKIASTQRQYTLEAMYVIFIKNFPVFVPPKNPIVNIPIQTLYLRRDHYYARRSSLTASAWAACGHIILSYFFTCRHLINGGEISRNRRFSFPCRIVTSRLVMAPKDSITNDGVARRESLTSHENELGEKFCFRAQKRNRYVVATRAFLILFNLFTYLFFSF